MFAIYNDRRITHANSIFSIVQMNGPTATREIRALGCDSYIVGVTGNVLASDVSFFVSCGANAVLPKPVDVKKLELLWIEHGVTGHCCDGNADEEKGCA